MKRRRFLTSSFAASTFLLASSGFGGSSLRHHGRNYKFDRTISREVLDNYLSRSISMEGLLNGRGDLNDNIRMLKSTGAKYIGRSICLWGGEANLSQNFERAKQQVPQAHAADPEMILEACIFEIVTCWSGAGSHTGLDIHSPGFARGKEKISLRRHPLSVSSAQTLLGQMGVEFLT